MSASSEENYILSSVARDRLQLFSLRSAMDHLDTRGNACGWSHFERMVIYTHFLVARGKFVDIVEFLDAMPEDMRRRVVNHAMYHTWWGNTLNMCLYWNTGHDALGIYRYLVNCGAVAIRDYYGQYPWDQGGSRYICPLRYTDVTPGHWRNPEEFAETCADVLRFFGPEENAGIAHILPSGTPFSRSRSTTMVSTMTTDSSAELSPDDRVITCRLHCPSSRYTRNSAGYYGSYAPDCNGCAVGLLEAEEQVIADRIRSNTNDLYELWTTQYNDASIAEAQRICDMLVRDIEILESMTTVVVTPNDYARRMLTLHDMAMNLHHALQPNAGSFLPAQAAFTEEIRVAGFDALNSAPILTTSRARLASASPPGGEPLH